MEAVIRSFGTFIVLLVLFRIIGRRTLGEMTNFDLVLLLVIGDATQQALLADDYSMMNAFIVVLTLMFADSLLSAIKFRVPRAERWVEGQPIVLIHDGEWNQQAARREEVNESDVMEAARSDRGLSELAEVRHAVLECNGRISVVARQPE